MKKQKLNLKQLGLKDLKVLIQGESNLNGMIKSKSDLVKVLTIDHGSFEANKLKLYETAVNSKVLRIHMNRDNLLDLQEKYSYDISVRKRRAKKRIKYNVLNEHGLTPNAFKKDNKNDKYKPRIQKPSTEKNNTPRMPTNKNKTKTESKKKKNQQKVDIYTSEEENEFLIKTKEKYLTKKRSIKRKRSVSISSNEEPQSKILRSSKKSTSTPKTNVEIPKKPIVIPKKAVELPKRYVEVPVKGLLRKFLIFSDDKVTMLKENKPLNKSRDQFNIKEQRREQKKDKKMSNNVVRDPLSDPLSIEPVDEQVYHRKNIPRLNSYYNGHTIELSDSDTDSDIEDEIIIKDNMVTKRKQNKSINVLQDIRITSIDAIKKKKSLEFESNKFQENVSFYLSFPKVKHPQKSKLNFDFDVLVQRLKRLRLPNSSWKIKVIFKNKEINHVIFTNKIVSERTVICYAKTMLCDIIINGKNALLLGAPPKIDCVSDFELFLNILDHISSKDLIIMYL